MTGLADFDMARRSFGVTFWLWMLHSNPGYDPHKSVEIVNARSDRLTLQVIEMVDGLQWY